MLFNQVSSTSKLLEQMQQTSSDCDHDIHDNSATELQKIHVVTDIETNFTIGANGLSSAEQHCISRTNFTDPRVSRVSFMGPTVSRHSFTGPTASRASFMGPRVSRASFMGPTVSRQSFTGPTVSRQLHRP